MFDVTPMQTLPIPAEPVPVRVREASALIPLPTETVLLACCLCKILEAPVISCTLRQVSAPSKRASRGLQELRPVHPEPVCLVLLQKQTTRLPQDTI